MVRLLLFTRLASVRRRLSCSHRSFCRPYVVCCGPAPGAAAILWRERKRAQTSRQPVRRHRVVEEDDNDEEEKEEEEEEEEEEDDDDNDADDGHNDSGGSGEDEGDEGERDAVSRSEEVGLATPPASLI